MPSTRHSGPGLSLPPWPGGLQVWGGCQLPVGVKASGQSQHMQLQRLRVEEVWGWWKTSLVGKRGPRGGRAFAGALGFCFILA